MEERYTLRGDQRRQAVPSLRAYEYQIWRTIHDWLDLSEDELIFVEGVEDYDTIAGSQATLTQVKDTRASGNITLRSEDVVEAINNYWNARTSNVDYNVYLYFITTAEIGVERGSPFGSQVAGLAVWNECRDALDPERGKKLADQIRAVLLPVPKISTNLHRFLEQASPREVRHELVSRIVWVTSEPRLDAVKDAVRRKLVFECDRKAINSRDVDRIMDRLHGEVWATATRADARILDRRRFIELFDEATSITLRRGEAGALLLAQEAGQQNVAALAAALGLSPGLAGVSVRPLTLGEPPPLPAHLLPRPQVVGDLSKRLADQGVLVVTGSTGMGKTTLAATLASADPNAPWLWLSCRGRSSNEIEALLWHAGYEVDSRRGRVSIVIDDLDLQGDLRTTESILLSLVFTVRVRTGRIILTSAAEMPQRLRLALGVGLDHIFQAPRFTDEEIHDLLVSHGCPHDLTQTWSRIVAIETSGHPQLVNARIQALRVAGFPPPTVGDLVEIPPHVKEARSEARRLIAAHLADSQRELLYRLSLCVGDFSRELALSIARLPQSIAFPGDAFDALVGPWVEVSGPGRFAVSPLVKGCGSDAHGPEWERQMRSGIAWSMLERRSLSPFEVSEILTHALLGSDGRALTTMIAGLMSSAQTEWPILARFLGWIVHVGTRDRQMHMPGDGITRLLFRIFQYRVAAATEPKFAVTLNALIERELLSVADNRMQHMLALLWCGQVLFAYDVDYGLADVNKYFQRWLGLIEAIRKDVDLYTEPAPDLAIAGPDGRIDPASAYPMFLVRRLDSVEDLEQLVDTLENTEPSLRERMLRWPARDQVAADFLVNQVWLAEYQMDSPSWRELVAALERLYQRAYVWGAPALAQAAATIASRTYDENLREPANAERVLESAEEGLGSSRPVRNARAMLHYNQGDYEKALRLWDTLLPEWEATAQPGDLGIVFAYANAARAAANLPHWKRALDLFLSAYRCSLRFDQRPLTTGLLADGAFAAWKAGMPERAVSLFHDSLQNLEGIPNDPSKGEEFTLYKRMGHVLMWMADHDQKYVVENFSEPPPGCCSNLDTPAGITNLNPTPIEMLWATLAAIEYKYTGQEAIYAKVATDSRVWRCPAFAFTMTNLEVDISCAKLDIDRALRAVIGHVRAIKELRHHTARGYNAWQASESEGELFTHDEEAIFHYKCAMVSLLFGLCARAPERVAQEIEKAEATAEAIHLPREFMSFVTTVKAMLYNKAIAGRVIMDSAVEYHIRCVASLVASISPTTPPGHLLYAHANLFDGWIKKIYLRGVGHDAAIIVCRAWAAVVDRGFLLRMPTFTVPGLRAACESNCKGWAKVGKIILAALPGTNIRVPEEMMRQLRAAAADNSDGVRQQK